MLYVWDDLQGCLVSDFCLLVRRSSSLISSSAHRSALHATHERSRREYLSRRSLARHLSRQLAGPWTWCEQEAVSPTCARLVWKEELSTIMGELSPYINVGTVRRDTMQKCTTEWRRTTSRLVIEVVFIALRPALTVSRGTPSYVCN